MGTFFSIYSTVCIAIIIHTTQITVKRQFSYNMPTIEGSFFYDLNIIAKDWLSFMCLQRPKRTLCNFPTKGKRRNNTIYFSLMR